MRRFALIAALVLVVSGCGGQEDEGPKTRVKLSADRSELTLGRSATLSGTVRPRAAEVELLAAEAPAYVNRRRIDSARPDGDGRFRFVVEPRRNTAYTVRAPDGADSNNVVVYAAPRYEVGVEDAGGGRSRVTFKVRHPTELVPTRAPVQFYAGHTRFVRVGEAPFEQRSPTLAVATSAPFVPPIPDAEGLACLEEPIAPGYGAPPVEGCGNRRLKIFPPPP